MKKSSYLLSILAVGLALPAQAAVLVNYDGTNNYVSADTNFNTTTTQTATDPYTFTNAFSDSTQLSPASGYTGPTFYGGYEYTSSTIDKGLSKQMVRDLADGTPIYLQAYNGSGWEGSALSLHGIYVFRQQDFNPGYETGNISLNGISMTWDGYGNTAGSEPFDFEGRLAVEIGGQYYLSDTVINLNTYGGNFSISGSTLSSVQWATYDPTSDLNFDAGSASFNDMDLDNIAAVGIYFEEDGWNGTNAQTTSFGFGIESFEATGTAIPEPSHMGALFGAVCLMGAWVARRRTRRA